MRTSLLPSSRTPFDRFTSILVRVLSLIGIVGTLVVVLHSLPGEKGKAASVSAAPSTKQVEAPRMASTAPAGGSPRVVYASPAVAPGAAPAPAAPVQTAPPQPAPVAALSANPGPPAASPAPAPAVSVSQSKPVPAAPPAPAAQSTPAVPFAAAAPSVPAAQPAPTRSASIETKPAPSAAGRLVNLNTASVEELNKLNGAGMIGRSVVRGRPYTSPEDLLAKRILNRSTYERIKGQITVR